MSLTELTEDHKHATESAQEAFSEILAECERLKDELRDAHRTIEEMKRAKPMTPKQRSAAHLYFEKLSNALNAAGKDMRLVLREDLPIPWTKNSVKERLWKPVLDAMYGKGSTEDQTTVNVIDVYDAVNLAVIERSDGVSVPWPSKEEMSAQGERRG